MNRRDLLAAGAALGAAGLAPAAHAQKPFDWDGTDMPSVPAPKYAAVLFDGLDLNRWVSRKDGSEAKWKVENGTMEVVPGTGDIYTKDTFVDYLLHVEFWLPLMAEATGQGRSNSGVYNQGRIEVQVLDSYGLVPKDNDCGGIYKIAPPLVNACKKPERWQSYDIAYRAPRFDAAGKQTEKGRITVIQNGVLIHNSQEFDAQVTTAGLPGDLTKPGPILLQDHGNRVRFRNIWIIPARPLDVTRQA